MTSFLEKPTVKLASQIVPIPTNVCLKDGMMRTLVGNVLIIWGMGRLTMEANFSMWPLMVPIHTLGALGLEFCNGASGAI